MILNILPFIKSSMVVLIAPLSFKHSFRFLWSVHDPSLMRIHYGPFWEVSLLHGWASNTSHVIIMDSWQILTRMWCIHHFFYFRFCWSLEFHWTWKCKNHSLLYFYTISFTQKTLTLWHKNIYIWTLLTPVELFTGWVSITDWVTGPVCCTLYMNQLYIGCTQSYCTQYLFGLWSYIPMLGGQHVNSPCNTNKMQNMLLSSTAEDLQLLTMDLSGAFNTVGFFDQ